jgi:hypothetical protein
VPGDPWTLAGRVLIACNCDYGCPCNFNARPTQGHCEGGWAWHVERGRYGDTPLDGLAFGVWVQWPGAIHEGDGQAVVLYDERADEAQREAIETLVGGEVGGPWGVLAWTWTVADGPHAVPWEAELSGVDSSLKAGDYVEVRSEPIRNPVSGAEVHPGAVLPEGIILKRADFGSSAPFRVANGIRYEHEGRYTAVGPFEYSGPPDS